MDFQSLTRRELQSLCKKNKIPANLTNVAMADALQALPYVEGIGELANPSESENPQSPERATSGSPDIPRTVCRTSTRRKPIKDEPKSSQLSIRTGRGSRRRMTEGVEEEQKKENVPETPAVPSSRQRAPVAYSTRRSVRLAEKKLAELSLNERGWTQPVKISDLSNEMPQDVDDAQDNNGMLGANKQEVFEKSSERTDNSEIVSDQNSNEVLKSEGNSKEKVTEGHALHDEFDVNEKLEVSEEKGTEVVEDGVAYDDSNRADLPKPEVGCEGPDESDVSLGEKWEKAVGLHKETKPIEKNGCDDFPATGIFCDADKSNEVFGFEDEQDSSIGHSISLDDSAILISSTDKFKEESDGEISYNHPVEYQERESYSDNLPKGEMASPEQLGSEKEAEIPEFIFCEKAEEESDERPKDSSNTTRASLNTTLDNENLWPEEPISDQLVEVQVAIGFSDKESIDFDVFMAPLLDDDAEFENDNCDSETDNHGMGVEKTAMETTDELVTDQIPPSTLAADIMPKNKTLCLAVDLISDIDIEQEELVLPTNVHSVMQMSDLPPPVSDEEAKGEIPFSNWAIDPHLGDIPRPTQLTPRKSSSKKQTTTHRRMTDVLDYNKENIDNSGRKVELLKQNMKKNKEESAADVSASTPLNDKSLRKLNKMLKEQLQITSKMKIDEKQNAVMQQEEEEGKVRQALQALAEN